MSCSQISPETATRKRKQFASQRSSSATSDESVLAKYSVDDELYPSVDTGVDTGGRLIQEEKIEVGSIPLETYNTYIKAAGGYILAIFVLSMFIVNVVGTGINNNFLYIVKKLSSIKLNPMRYILSSIFLKL